MILGVTQRIRGKDGFRIGNARQRRWMLSALGMVMFLLFWEGATRLGGLHETFFPPPTAILVELHRIHEPVLSVLPNTLYAAFTGYFVSLVLSIAIAIPLVASERLREALMPIIVGTNTIPRVAMTPLVIYWVGFFTTGYLFVANYIMAAWVAFFPMLIAALDGFRTIDERRETMLQLYGATTWQEFKYVRFKNGLPFIFDAMKYGFILAMIGAVVGEFVSRSSGIGSMAASAVGRTAVDRAIALVLVLGVISTVVVFVIYMIENRIIHWQDSTFMGGDE